MPIGWPRLRGYQKAGAIELAERIRRGLFAAAGLGKALAHGSKVLTPTGWTAIEDLRIDDAVVDPGGGTAKVTGVYPQGVQDVFRLATKDGASVVCTADHLWSVQTATDRARQKPFRVVKTSDMSGNLTRSSGKGQKHEYFLPLLKPIQARSTAELPVPPHLLGVLLGNGDLVGSIRVSNDTSGKQNPLLDTLRELGLEGRRSYEKWIPPIYFDARPSDRLELLQGLMDTAGDCSKGGTAIFNTSSSKLARDMIALVRGLGGIASLSIAYEGQQRTGKPAFRINVRLPVCPFTLKRKADRWHKPYMARAITEIEPAGRAACTCISVDSQSSCFITDGYIVTHNTAEALAALYIADVGFPWLIVTRAIGRHVWPRDARWVLGPDFVPGVLWAGSTRSKTGYHADGSYTSLDLAMSECLAVVTNYEVLAARAPELLSVPWKAMVLDESHHVKGGFLPPQFKRDGKLHRTRYHHAKDLAINVHYRGGMVMPVTATPIANRRNDLWSQLDLALPGPIFASRSEAYAALSKLNQKRRAAGKPWLSRKLVYETPNGLFALFGEFGPALVYGELEHPSAEAVSFLRRYCDAHEGTFGGVDSSGESNTAELRARIGRRFIRLSREEVQAELPALQRDVRTVTPAEEPKLFLGGGYENALARAALVKQPFAVEMALDYLANGDKVLIATNRRKLAHMMRDAVEKARRNLPAKIRDELWIESVTGETEVRSRVALLNSFNETSKPACMCATTDCLSETINLHYVPGAIVAGLPITPKLIGQFEGRFGRLGGIPCTVHYLVAEGTIDEEIRRTLLDKLSDVCETGTDTSGAGTARTDLANMRDEEEIIAGLRAWLSRSN